MGATQRIMFRALDGVKLRTKTVCSEWYGPAGLNRSVKEGAMTAFEEHQEDLEKYERMFGPARGRLAVSLDRVTNALVLVGQHGVYCRSQRDAAVPAMDIQIITQELGHAKELIQSVMEELRRSQAPGERK
jgi:hypothetical protein